MKISPGTIEAFKNPEIIALLNNNQLQLTTVPLVIPYPDKFICLHPVIPWKKRSTQEKVFVLELRGVRLRQRRPCYVFCICILWTTTTRVTPRGGESNGPTGNSQHSGGFLSSQSSSLLISLSRWWSPLSMYLLPLIVKRESFLQLFENDFF